MTVGGDDSFQGVGNATQGGTGNHHVQLIFVQPGVHPVPDAAEAGDSAACSLLPTWKPAKTCSY